MGHVSSEQAIKKRIAANLSFGGRIQDYKETATVKFDDPWTWRLISELMQKSDQAVRGSVVLPSGTGKTARGGIRSRRQSQEALQRVPTSSGLKILERIKGGDIDFDVAIASPDAMRIVGQLGQILGPRGLMPNPKVGTVTPDVAGAVRNAKAGQIQYRADKAGIVQCPIGRASFSAEALTQNLLALLDALNKSKPATSKGIYLRKISISSTME